MPSVHRGTLALGLLLIGLGISLFAVGGTAYAAERLLRGELHDVRSLIFLVVVGLAMMVTGSFVVGYLGFEQY